MTGEGIVVMDRFIALHFHLEPGDPLFAAEDQDAVPEDILDKFRVQVGFFSDEFLVFPF